MNVQNQRHTGHQCALSMTFLPFVSASIFSPFSSLSLLSLSLSLVSLSSLPLHFSKSQLSVNSRFTFHTQRQIHYFFSVSVPKVSGKNWLVCWVRILPIFTSPYYVVRRWDLMVWRWFVPMDEVVLGWEGKETIGLWYSCFPFSGNLFFSYSLSLLAEIVHVFQGLA